MKKLNQSEFSALVAWQKSGRQDSPDHDIHDIELSDISIVLNLDAVTITMSNLSSLSFGTASSLQGATWIGTEVRNCTFLGTAMDKGDMLDCVIEDSVFRNTTLFRADWSGSVFKRCTLEALDLSKTCLINVSFTDCHFASVQLHQGAMLNGRQNLVFDAAGKLKTV